MRIAPVVVFLLAAFVAGGWLLFRTAAGAPTPAPLKRGAEARGIELADAPEADGAATAKGRVVARTPFQPDEDDAADAAVFLLGDSEGRPLAGAEIVLIEGGAAALRETSDDRGRVRFPADDEPSTLLILALGRPPFAVDVRMVRGTRRIEAPLGVSVSGSATIDGRGPEASIRLKLTGGTPFPGLESTPSAAWGATESEARRAFEVEAPVGRDGTFVIRGLPRGFAARLSWPVEYERATSGAPYEDVVAPAAGVLISLKRSPLVAGRVLHADGETSVVKADVAVKVLWRMQSRTFRVRTDAEGRFAHAMPRCSSSGLPPVAVELSATSDDGRSRATAMVEGDCGMARDAGDLILKETARRTIVVVDQNGAPLADAVALDGEGRLLRADAEGRIELTGSASVVAPGRARSEVDGARVVLRSAATIDVLASRADGKPDDSILVRITTSVRAVADPDDALRGVSTKGSIVAATTAPDGRLRYDLRPDAEGRVRLGFDADEADVEASLVVEGAAPPRFVRLRRGVAAGIDLVVP